LLPTGTDVPTEIERTADSEERIKIECNGKKENIQKGITERKGGTKEEKEE
jgi:hypothetical protein